MKASPIFEAFGEVWASFLTKCRAEKSQTVAVGNCSLASGEVFGSNLTKCPKMAQNVTFQKRSIKYNDILALEVAWDSDLVKAKRDFQRNSGLKCIFVSNYSFQIIA